MQLLAPGVSRVRFKRVGTLILSIFHALFVLAFLLDFEDPRHLNNQ